jgi:hypothetical protein
MQSPQMYVVKRNGIKQKVMFDKITARISNLIEENYTNVLISLSLNDKWFVRRKYD